MTCRMCGFGTAEPENNAEQRTCKNGNCQICLQVAELDQEIRRLAARLDNLRLEQNRAHDPLHRLPVELKNYIFELLLPSRDEWGQIFPTERTKTPSYYASICRGWRDIVWSNPFLWSVMHIVLGEPTSYRLKFIRDWVLRSRTLPLTCHIQVRAFSRDALSPVLDVMSQKLQSLSLDIPHVLHAFQPSNLALHRLMRLRILPSHHQIKQSLPFLNATASPEKVTLYSLSFESLQMSWNRLSYAKIRDFNLTSLTQLFQHASQMTDCHITSFTYDPESFSMPPIIHYSLKILSLYHLQDGDVGPAFLGSLTLPCLQEFDTDKMDLITHLPALVQRSSCRLRRLLLSHDLQARPVILDRLQPLPGVTDLVLKTLGRKYQAAMVQNLLLKQYFPDLRRLTLRLQPFVCLWNVGVIGLLLDRRRLRSDGPNAGKLKCLVSGQDEASDFGMRVKALGVSLIQRGDGFEFLLL